MEIISSKIVYKVMTNSDLTEGRGYEYPLYFCESETTAKRLAKGRYVQGTDCSIFPTLAVLVSEESSEKQMWMVEPTMIHPSAEDIEIDKKLAEKRKMEDEKDSIVCRMLAKGFTKEEIALFSGNK